LSKLSCKVLFNIFKGLSNEPVEELAVLLLYQRYTCLGRVAVAKKLGISERRARSLIDKLNKKGYLAKDLETCINTRSFPYNLSYCSTKFNNYYLTAFLEANLELLKLVERSITMLRDYIVLASRDPEVLEIVGYTSEGRIYLPRVPRRMREKYARKIDKLIPQILSTPSLFIVWRSYKPYLSEACLLYSLYRLCTSF